MPADTLGQFLCAIPNKATRHRGRLETETTPDCPLLTSGEPACKLGSRLTAHQEPKRPAPFMLY